VGGVDGGKDLSDPDLELVGEDSTDSLTLDFFLFFASFLVGSLLNSAGFPANFMPDSCSDILTPAMA